MKFITVLYLYVRSTFMKKVFLRRFLSMSLILSIALTFNFIGYGNNVQAKDLGKEKIFIKNRDGSASTDKYVNVSPIPENFDITNATDKELEYYNIPKRPTNSLELAKWKKLYSCKWVKPEIIETTNKHQTFKYATSTTTSAEISTNAKSTTYTTSNSSSWSGYVNKQLANSVLGDWFVPKVSAPSSQIPGYSCQWIGLGGYGSDTLVQDGTEADVNSDGSISYSVWYELLGTDYKSDRQLRLSNIPIEPGDEFDSRVSMSVNGNTMTVNFAIGNDTQNVGTSFSITVDNFTNIPNTSEWISEATAKPDLKSYPLTTDIGTNANAVAFADGEYTDANNQEHLIKDATNLVKVPMNKNGKELASPTEIGSGTEGLFLFFWLFYEDSFNINWENYN